MEIVLGGENIDYTLRVSSRARRIRLTVNPGGVLLATVPRGASRRHAEDFMVRNARWVIEKIEDAKRLPQKISKHDARKKYAYHKEAARGLAHERLVHFNKIYGFTWGRIAIRNQSSRWGSCSKKGNINFNYKIALLPAHLADYVIVHELCHLGEFNHSERFWNLVAQAFPNHQEARKELKRTGIGE